MTSTMRGPTRWVLGLVGVALLAFGAGCPDTTIGAASTSSSTSSGAGGGVAAPTLEWRQTIDLGELGIAQLRGWMRFTAGGTRAYVPAWTNDVALMTVTDGRLSTPTKVKTASACNLSDIRFRADEQVAFLSSYYKAECNHALSAFAVKGDGTFGDAALDTEWAGSAVDEPPDFAESIAVHPSGAWLYVAFANEHPTMGAVTQSSQIGRVDVGPDGTLSSPKLVATLDTGGVTEMTLAFSPAGDALYAVQYETGKVTRFYVDGATGELQSQPTVVAASTYAQVGPICAFGGEEHVYVASAAIDDLTGGVHHLRFNGPVLEASTVTGGKQHPTLRRVHSIVADPECRHLYAVGQAADTMVHVLAVDPGTGDTTWVSGVDGIAELDGRRRISMSPDGRFLYVVASCDTMATCTAGDPVAPVVHVFEIVAPQEAAAR